eukprot:5914192-Pleurochrysis_carterae.AAC.1
MAADNVDDALFARRCIHKLEPLDFQDTFSAYRRAVLDNPPLSHAHMRAELDRQRYKIKQLQERAEYDGYMRCRDTPRVTKYSTTRLHVGGIINIAKADQFARYNTGEPHPYDPDGWVLIGYVDAVTGWQMYRYDETYLQSENGNPGYFDPEAASKERKRWAAAAADLAHTIDAKPQPSDAESTSDRS